MQALQSVGVGSSHIVQHDVRVSTKESCSPDDHDENQNKSEDLFLKMRLLKNENGSYFVDLAYDREIFEYFFVDKKDLTEITDGESRLSCEVLAVWCE